MTGCLQGLCVLYRRTGREGEWARLVAEVTPEFIDPATDGPLPGRDDQWTIITGYRVRLAMAARDWPTATGLQALQMAWNRDQAAAALNVPDGQLTGHQRNQIRNLAVSLEHLAEVLRTQEDPGCLPHFEEAMSLYRRIGARTEEGRLALTLGNAYKDVPGLRDLDQAQHWYEYSLEHREEQDHLGRAKSLWGLGASPTSDSRKPTSPGSPDAVLLEHLNAALHRYQQALPLIPADDAEDLAGAAPHARPHLPLGRGHPPVPCATTSKPSSTTKPEGTATAPGRPASTSPSCSATTAGSGRAAVCPRRPAQLPGRPRRRLRRVRGRAAYYHPGTAQPVTRHRGRRWRALGPLVHGLRLGRVQPTGHFPAGARGQQTRMTGPNGRICALTLGRSPTRVTPCYQAICAHLLVIYAHLLVI